LEDIFELYEEELNKTMGKDFFSPRMTSNLIEKKFIDHSKILKIKKLDLNEGNERKPPTDIIEYLLNNTSCKSPTHSHMNSQNFPNQSPHSHHNSQGGSTELPFETILEGKAISLN
jgi:hypothetical protein